MVATVIYDITIVLAKTSILLQYITIFVVHRKNRFHYICHAFIAANVVMYIIVIFLYIFEVCFVFWNRYGDTRSTDLQ